MGLNPSIPADPACPNNFAGLVGDSWLYRSQVLWRRLLPPSPAVQTESWHRRGMCSPQEELQAHRRVVWSLQGALHQPACKLSAHPTSLLQKSRKKKWQSLQAIGLRSKEKAKTSILPEQYLPQAQHRGFYSLPLCCVIVRDLSLNVLGTSHTYVLV